MAEVKKRVFLTPTEKCEILEKIKNGASKHEILNVYNISERFYRKIVHSMDDVINQSYNLEFRNKKTKRSAKNVELETALLKWFVQKRDSGEPTSATVLQKKAREYNEMLSGPSSFKASDGWSSRFQKRHGLNKSTLRGEILSDDVNPVEEFAELLNEKIVKESVQLDNIYNADEAGIYWKIPLSTENSAAEIKERNERFTALFCANASGSHKVPLLIIGKSGKPRSLKNLISGEAQLHDMNYLKKLDVIYSAEEYGWMNSVIFKKWYEHEFIPRVLEHQKLTGISGKVLLILDNAPAHPSVEELNAINKNFEVKFLPPNIAASIQPMDQSPISTTKKNYKRNLIRRLIIEEDYEKIETFLKELSIRDCLVMLSTGWSSVKQTILKNAWKSLLGNTVTQKSVDYSSEEPEYDENSSSNETKASVEESNPIYEFREHLDKCLSKQDEKSKEMSKKLILRIEEWFEEDKGDSGWEILTDEQIVESVLNSKLEELESQKKMVGQTVFVDVKMEYKIDEDEIDENERIAASEALESFLKFKSWMTTRVQCSKSQISHFKECEKILRNTISKNSK